MGAVKKSANEVKWLRFWMLREGDEGERLVWHKSDKVSDLCGWVAVYQRGKT